MFKPPRQDKAVRRFWSSAEALRICAMLLLAAFPAALKAADPVPVPIPDQDGLQGVASPAEDAARVQRPQRVSVRVTPFDVRQFGLSAYGDIDQSAR